MENTTKLVRSRTDYMLGGVCGGLGKYFKIDPVFIRLIFLLITLAGGSGVLIYFILWIVMPREDTLETQQTNLDGAELGRRANLMGQEIGQVASQPSSRTIQFIGIGLVVAGLYYILQNLNIPWLNWINSVLVWPVLLIVAGAFLLLRALKK
jgi:phage shock protein PspC (stress-responsive transcriptional regulator)